MALIIGCRKEEAILCTPGPFFLIISGQTNARSWDSLTTFLTAGLRYPGVASAAPQKSAESVLSSRNLQRLSLSASRVPKCSLLEASHLQLLSRDIYGFRRPACNVHGWCAAAPPSGTPCSLTRVSPAWFGFSLLWTAAYLGGVNLGSAGLIFYDKKCAEARQWRVPEATLCATALAGGWMGGM